MTKLLVIDPRDVQQLIEVQEGGGYFDTSRVLWDERLDGSFPSGFESKVGGLARSPQGELTFDQAAFDAHADKISQEKQKEAQEKTKKNQARALLKNVNLNDNATIADLVPLIKAIAELLK